MAQKMEHKLPDAACLWPASGKTACDTLRLALELSTLAYDMDVAKYLDDGWQDVSFQVDTHLLTGFASRRSCEQAAARARSRMEKKNPISQYRGFKREKEELSTCKAVVMAHEVDGRDCIAIAFTGTTRRMYEWLGNLRVTEEDGFHAGFLQLTRLFEENEEKILFPALAKKEGREKCSLADVIQAMRGGSDRYCLFVTGHSQGAALMQIYIYHLLHSGVPGEYVRGIGFASPSVSAQRSVQLAADYPVLNIINADDVIARVGGQMHIGMCRVLPATAAFRRACYGSRADAPAMGAALDLMHQVRSTEDALLLFIALTESFLALPAEESEEVLSALIRRYLPDQLSQHLTGYARRMVRAIGRRLCKKCEQVAGRVQTERLSHFQAEWNEYFSLFGVREGAAMVMEALMRPHALSEPEQKRAYQTLVTEYEAQLVSCIWMRKDDPVWDRQDINECKKRQGKTVYNRFRPLSTQRRQTHDHQ
ncbi:MAG: hypothetical protein IKM26_07935 [Clostridia bacterium]|nr:hypothetical protein [Clostridia bacterium]